MPEDTNPPGRSHNPSAWPHRVPVFAFALAGFCISVYLTLYQLDVLRWVWEPFFGNGSHTILKESAVARYLPVPDAALGAFAYLCDLVADCLGGSDRWRTKPWAVCFLGLVSAGLAVTAVGLVLCQAFVFRAWCTLCLCSAACSLAGAAFAADEVMATIEHLRHETARGLSLRQALGGHGSS